MAWIRACGGNVEKFVNWIGSEKKWNGSWVRTSSDVGRTTTTSIDVTPKIVNGAYMEFAMTYSYATSITLSVSSDFGVSWTNILTSLPSSGKDTFISLAPFVGKQLMIKAVYGNVYGGSSNSQTIRITKINVLKD